MSWLIISIIYLTAIRPSFAILQKRAFRINPHPSLTPGALNTYGNKSLAHSSQCRQVIAWPLLFARTIRLYVVTASESANRHGRHANVTTGSVLGDFVWNYICSGMVCWPSPLRIEETGLQRETADPSVYLRKSKEMIKEEKARKLLILMVLRTGIEPVRPWGREILSLLCLPIPPSEHFEGMFLSG